MIIVLFVAGFLILLLALLASSDVVLFAVLSGFALLHIYSGYKILQQKKQIRRLEEERHQLENIPPPSPEYIKVPVPVEMPPEKPAMRRVDDMSGAEFEAFCADILKENHFENIQMTPASGDHGVDLVAWRVNRKFAIQCKRYTRTVGNKAVQEVHAGRKLYACSEAAVLTSSYFSPQAEEEASELGVMLWDRDKLYEFMRNADVKDVVL